MENNNNKNLSSVSLLEDDQGSHLNVPVIQAGASNVSVSLLEGKVETLDVAKMASVQQQQTVQLAALPAMITAALREAQGQQVFAEFAETPVHSGGVSGPVHKERGATIQGVTESPYLSHVDETAKNFDESRYEDSAMGTFDGVTMHRGGSHLQGDATQSETTGEVAQTYSMQNYWCVAK